MNNFYRLLNIRELSKLLDISVNTIYAMVSQKRIPYVKVGRLTKFDVQQIKEWIKKNSIKEEKF